MEFSREGSNWPTPILQLDPLMHLYISIVKISKLHVQQFLILFSLKIYCQYLTDLCVKMQKYKNMPCLRFWSAKVQYTCVQCLIFSVQICCSYIFLSNLFFDSEFTLPGICTSGFWDFTRSNHLAQLENDVSLVTSYTTMTTDGCSH